MALIHVNKTFKIVTFDGEYDYYGIFYIQCSFKSEWEQIDELHDICITFYFFENIYRRAHTWHAHQMNIENNRKKDNNNFEKKNPLNVVRMPPNFEFSCNLRINKCKLNKYVCVKCRFGYSLCVFYFSRMSFAVVSIWIFFECFWMEDTMRCSMLFPCWTNNFASGLVSFLFQRWLI